MQYRTPKRGLWGAGVGGQTPPGALGQEEEAGPRACKVPGRAEAASTLLAGTQAHGQVPMTHADDRAQAG